MYALLTKREVKIAEFLPSSLFAFVWTKDKVGVNITVILAEQLHGQKKN